MVSVRFALAIFLVVAILGFVVEAGYKKPPFNGSIFGKRSNSESGKFQWKMFQKCSMCPILFVFFFFLFQSYVPNEKRQKQEENELHETFNIAWMNLPIILLYISIRDNNFIIANTERRDQKFLDDFKNHWETYSGNIFLFFLRIAKLHVELVEHKKW